MQIVMSVVLNASLVLLQLLVWHSVAVNGFTKREREQLQLERAEAARIWAPLVQLHPHETIFPTAVHTFLQNVKVETLPEDINTKTPPVGVPISRSLDMRPLPEGEISKHSYLVAPIDPECSNCALPAYLLGEKPNEDYSPPAYAVISSCLPQEKQQSDNIFRRVGRGFRRQGFGKRITDTIRRASRHIRDKYFKSRSRRKGKHHAPDGSVNKIITVKFEGTLPSPALVPPPSQTMNLGAIRERLESLQASVVNSPEGKAGYTLVFKSQAISRRSDNDSNSLENHTPHNPKPPTKVYRVFKKCTPDEQDCIDTRTKRKISTEIHKNKLTAHKQLQSTEDNIIHGHFSNEQSVENDVESSSKDLAQVKQPKDTSKMSKHRKGHHFTITYWMFYPYSRGKPVCTSKLWILGRVFKPRLRNKCYGEEVTLNDHVGDWEHISIFFEDGLPERMYVSSHFYGAFYQYVPDKHIFEYRGKDARHPLPVSAKFPLTIKLKGTHPIVYSALGSHGLWGGPGIHRYMNFIPLQDETANGIPWKTWHNIDVIDYRDPQHDREHRQWLRFQGHWGNPSHKCHRGLFGICALSKGPTGIPRKRENFPCGQPQHSTFHPDKG